MPHVITFSPDSPESTDTVEVDGTYGRPVITLQGWAESVHLYWKELDVELCYQYENGWGIKVADRTNPDSEEGMWVNCEISPRIPIPQVFLTYYGLIEVCDEPTCTAPEIDCAHPNHKMKVVKD